MAFQPANSRATVHRWGDSQLVIGEMSHREMRHQKRELKLRPVRRGKANLLL